MKWLSSLVATAMIAVGCDGVSPQSQPEPSSQAPATTASPPADPVGDFRVIAKSFLPRAVDEYNKFSAAEGVDQFYTVTSSISFDVQKTDSLISPFTADIHATGAWDTKRSKIGVVPIEITFLFAYQDGKWVPQSGGFSGKLPSGTPFNLELTDPQLQLAMPSNQ